MSTSVPVVALRASARRVCCSSESSTAERTSATWRPSCRADRSSSSSTICGQLPPATGGHHQGGEADGHVGGPGAEQLLDDLLAAFRREVGVAEGVTQRVVALDGPGDSEELVAHRGQLALGVGHRVHRRGVGPVAVALGHQLLRVATESMNCSTRATLASRSRLRPTTCSAASMASVATSLRTSDRTGPWRPRCRRRPAPSCGRPRHRPRSACRSGSCPRPGGPPR